MTDIPGTAPVGVRREKLLHPWKEPVDPRPAATVLLLRDGAQGIEVLMTRRSLQASFLPGAYVFPGGVVDPHDDSELAHSISRLRDDQDDALFPFFAAAAREAFEELGILLARPRRPGASVVEAAASLDRDQDEAFYERVEGAGLELALDELYWLSRWTTNPDLPKRFDTRFFVGRMPPNQIPQADETEQFEPTWIRPSEALARNGQDDFSIILPTIRTLEILAGYDDIDSFLQHCTEHPGKRESTPRAGLRHDEIELFSEHELPFGELALVCPDGQPLHDLTWQHERAVPILRHVQRLTAPNPGRMTGPGTNTWIIGEAGDYLVIDPGPDDPGHIQRIADIVGEDLHAIVCTHAHPDHAPGAAPLKALTGGQAPIIGRPTGPLFDPQWAFTPERTLEDGDRLTVGDSALRVLHTPGHVSNHICLLLEEDGLLFSGDHILSGSTTVITPPDGDMREYVASLHRLAGEPFEFILPAHGHVIAAGKNEVARLIAHRMAREAKVLAALRGAGGPATIDQLVITAYDDVDPIIRPVAKRSLAAHLLKLRDDGVLTQDDEHWQFA